MDWDAITDRLQTLGDNLGKGLKRLFGSQTQRAVGRLQPMVQAIADKESWAQGLSAEQFVEQTEAWKKAVQAEETTLDEVLPEAFALVREASVRTLGLRHFDVQMVGGIVMHNGTVAEMATGEGKTLVATLSLYLNCLTGRPCYLVTVNDYLARRDATWMGPIYKYLGVSVGAIQSDMSPQDRQAEYACDIVYGTNNEFGFDYLRDNMKLRVGDQVQKHLFYAIVDEVDSILIDEARTPLIISGPTEELSDKYKLADKVARALELDRHFEVKEKERSASLLEEGIEAAQKLVGVDSFYTPGNEDWPHFIENALRAHNLYAKDREYVVEPNPERGGAPEVVIVDEFTGRKMTGRRWSDGLHQAVETKEGLVPRQENQTLATITFQNYFRLFDKLAGMTGTALTEANEFSRVYGLNVITIPTNEPIARADEMDVVFRTEPEKWKALVEEIREVNDRGQPMLVGTTSVEKSELLSGMLKRRGVTHSVLNAKHHEKEAQIVAMAGERSAVTVATNMAGRGTDIKLGGNFEYLLKRALAEKELEEGDLEHLEEIDSIREEIRARCARDEAEVLEQGGLYVLCSERHEARRIDNQLRGRSGRQGDVGRSRFFLSLQDDLMRRFYKDWVVNAMEKLGMEEGVPIESRMVTRAIERAQRKVEDYNFEIRKSLLEYDEVMDQQRRTIYGVRQDTLEGRELREKIETMLGSVVERAAATYADDPEGFIGWYQRTFGSEVSEAAATAAVDEEPDSQPALEAVLEAYNQREEVNGPESMREVERYVLLNTIDAKWKDHLRAIDALKTGIGLRGYAQLDPKNEYKREGFELFQKLLLAVEDEVTSLILRIRLADEADQALLRRRRAAEAVQYSGPAKTAGARPTRPSALGTSSRVPATHAFDMEKRRRALSGQAAPGKPGAEGAATAQAERPQPARQEQYPGVGRNDPCPCGSGKKFKKCHG